MGRQAAGRAEGERKQQQEGSQRWVDVLRLNWTHVLAATSSWAGCGRRHWQYGILGGFGFTVLAALCYSEMNNCCHCSIIWPWAIWLLADKRECLIIMGFCVSLLSSRKKKNVFKDLALFTLGKKISFKNFDSFLPIAILVGLSIRGKCYLQHILQMK